MQTQQTRSPGWLRALGAFALLVIAGSMVFAVAIGVLNFSRIGV